MIRHGVAYSYRTGDQYLRQSLQEVDLAFYIVCNICVYSSLVPLWNIVSDFLLDSIHRLYAVIYISRGIRAAVTLL